MPEPTTLTFTADAIVDTVREPMLVLSAGLRVRRANRAFYRAFAVTPEKTINRFVYELGDGQWDIPKLRSLLEDMLPQNTSFDDFEVVHDFPGTGRKVMLLNARRIHQDNHDSDLILLAIEDVTERRRLEDERRELETRFTSLVQNVRDHSIFALDTRGHITSWNREAERILRCTEAEALGRHFSIIFTPEDVRDGIPALELATALSEGRAEDERWHMRKNGERFWALGIVTPTRDAAGAHTGYSKILRDMTERKRAEEALRASEERLRLILESATDFAIFTLARDRTVTSWSPGAEATFGFAAAEIVGRSGDVIYTPEDRAAGVPEGEAEEARRAGRAADERWHVRRDGARIWASGMITPLRDGAGGFVKVLRDATARKRLADALHRARAELEGRVQERTADLERALDALEAEMGRRRDLARQLSTAQEDERRRVARDLHDTVGQLLAGLSLGFKAIETGGDLAPPAAARLAEAQRIMSDLGRELHGLAVRVRPTSLDDIGLEAALGQLVAEWSARSGVTADCHAAGVGRGRLPTEVETAVYRVVQEALTNVAKHARATAVGVVVTRRDGHVSVVVEDDGAGFDPATLPKGRLGLLGMRERVELVGGTIDVESSPGAGTTVAVQIPVPSNGGGS